MYSEQWCEECQGRAASTAIDAVGLLPEGGTVAGAFSLWHGAAGVSNGIKILQRVKFGAGIISTASAGSDASGDGALSLAGAQLFTGFASIGAGLAKATPIVGQVISGISVSALGLLGEAICIHLTREKCGLARTRQQRTDAQLEQSGREF